jgi:hypothetical protein
LLYAAALHRDSIFVVNLATGIVIEEWKTIARPYKIQMHPSGRIFYVSGMGASRIALHDAVSGDAAHKTPTEAEPMDLAYSAKKPEPAEGGEPDLISARGSSSRAAQPIW